MHFGEITKNILKIVVLLLFILVFVGLNWAPIYSREYVGDENTLVSEFAVDDIIGFNSCRVQDESKIKVVGADAYIIFNTEESYISGVEIELAKASKKDYNFQIYCDYGDGYDEFLSYRTRILKGQKKVTIPVTEGYVYSIRIDNDKSYRLKTVKTFEEIKPYINISKIQLFRILIGFAMASFVFGLIMLLDKKWKIWDRIINVISKFRWSIGIAIVVMILQIVCINYSNYILAFFFAILALVTLMIVQWKRFGEQPEVIIGGIAFVVGVTMMLISPFGHTCWDVETHYMWALKDSYIGNNTRVSEADYIILTNSPLFSVLPEDIEDNEQIIDMVNISNSIIDRYVEYPFSVAHIPAGVGIAVGRLLNLSFYWIYVCGCLANLLTYVILITAAISRLHSGKMLLSVISLFPTSLLLATNYTYDFWVIGFSLLGIAYFVANCQEKDRTITNKDSIIMCLSIMLACIPKSIYAPLLLIPFLLPIKKISNKKLYYVICAVSFCLLCVILKIVASQVIANGGDARGGTVSTTSQLDFILAQPIEYAKILIGFLREYLSIKNMSGYITLLGYFDAIKGVAIFQIMLLVTLITDKKECDKNSYPIICRIYVVLAYFGTAALVATALFISFTPIGSTEIMGCQPRYIIPLLYPMLSIIAGGGVSLIRDKDCAFYNCLIIIPCEFVIMYGIYNNVMYYI